MNQQRKATLYGLSAVLVWSTVATAFKLSLRHLDHFQLLFLATVFSLVSLGAVLGFQGRFHLLLCGTRRQYRLVFGLGLLNPFIYYLVLFKAYDLLPAQVAQPLNYTWALTLSWLAVPLLGQKVGWRHGVAGLICYFGVVVLATGGNLTSFTVADPLGVALALGSTLVWALYWIGNTKSELDPVAGLFLGFAFALPFVTGTVLLFSDLRFGWQGLLGGAYVGAFEMGFTFVLWLSAMRLTSSTARIANFIFLAPFLSLVFIHFVLGEHVVPATIIGLVLIVGGLILQGSRGSGKGSG
ncbi:MAG: DMT family transporter [Candidatus Krumholzibacteriota bacterium]